MIFADLIDNENDFKEYLENRIKLYDRNDIMFSDEIDVLGFYFKGHFPLGEEKEKEILHIIHFKDEIENYYNQLGIGMPGTSKPKKES
jgi:hypothetical protein